jgi:hypothetical protein
LVIKTLDLELNTDPDPHWDLDPDPQSEKMLDPIRIRIRIKSKRIQNPALFKELSFSKKTNKKFEFGTTRMVQPLGNVSPFLANQQ